MKLPIRQTLASATLVALVLSATAQGSPQCRPEIYFIGGAWDKSFSGLMKDLYKKSKTAYEKASIRSGYDIHWQRETDGYRMTDTCGEAAKQSFGPSLACMGVAAILFPPAVLACFAVAPTVGLGCETLMNMQFGELGKKLNEALRRQANPIILIGHSLGAHTSHVMATHVLPPPKKEILTSYRYSYIGWR